MFSILSIQFHFTFLKNKSNGMHSQLCMEMSLSPVFEEHFFSKPTHLNGRYSVNTLNISSQCFLASRFLLRKSPDTLKKIRRSMPRYSHNTVLRVSFFILLIFFICMLFSPQTIQFFKTYHQDCWCYLWFDLTCCF